MKLNNKDEALAFAKFILFERKRHLDDIEWIDKVLMKLSKKWDLIIAVSDYKINGEELKDMWTGLDDI